VTTTGSTTLTTTVWVIDRVHNHTADSWTDTAMTVLTSFTDVGELVLNLPYLTNCGPAVVFYFSQLA
jgi:hypothetical protein